MEVRFIMENKKKFIKSLVLCLSITYIAGLSVSATCRRTFITKKPTEVERGVKPADKKRHALHCSACKKSDIVSKLSNFLEKEEKSCFIGFIGDEINADGLKKQLSHSMKLKLLNELIGYLKLVRNQTVDCNKMVL